MRRGLLWASTRNYGAIVLLANILRTPIPQDVCIFCASRLHFAAIRARKPSHVRRRALHSATPAQKPSEIVAIGSTDTNNLPTIHQSLPRPRSSGANSWAKSTWEDELTPEEEEQKRALKYATPSKAHADDRRGPGFQIRREYLEIARDSVVPRQRDGEGIAPQGPLFRKTASRSTPDGAGPFRRNGEDDQRKPADQNVVQEPLSRKTSFEYGYTTPRVQSKKIRAMSQQSHQHPLKTLVEPQPIGGPQIGRHLPESFKNHTENMSGKVHGEDHKSRQPRYGNTISDGRLNWQAKNLNSSDRQLEGAELQKSQEYGAPRMLHREKILNHHIAQDQDAVQGRLDSWTCLQCASTNSGWRNACSKCKARKESDSSQVQHWAHVKRKPSSVIRDSGTPHDAGYSEQPKSITQRVSGFPTAQISSGRTAQTRLSTDNSAPAVRGFQWPPVKTPDIVEGLLKKEGRPGNGQYVRLQGIRKVQPEQDLLIQKVANKRSVGQVTQEEARPESVLEAVELQRLDPENSIQPQVKQQSTPAENIEEKSISVRWPRWAPDESDLIVPELRNTGESTAPAQFDQSEASQQQNSSQDNGLRSNSRHVAFDSLQAGGSQITEHGTAENATNNSKPSGWVRWTLDAGLDNKIEAKTDPNPPSASMESQPLSVKPRRASKRALEFVVDEELAGTHTVKSQNAGYGRTSSRRGRPQRNIAEYDDIEEDQAEARAERRRQRKKEKVLTKRAGPPIPILLPEYITVANLATALKVRSEEFTRKMIALGFGETNNDHVLDSETAGLIAQEFNFEPVIDGGDGEDLVTRPAAEDKSSLPPRPPVVTIMGHVDHGKTTLLDYLRKSSVAASEHGGITQHIGAFSVSMPSGRIVTFLDTPGHAAFLSMRQRGANVTDIVVLVVAADDSVKPQTVEAIKHAQAAKVPMIVAVNKIDKEGTNVEAVKRDLARHSVDVEDYGGDTQVVCVSGKTGQGMDELEDAAIALADILDMRAETDGQAEGWVLEATTTKAGRVATVLVRRGTLRPGDVIVAGSTWARIRSLKNEAGVQVESAGPGTPVEVDGWREQPAAGDEVLQAPGEQKAKSVVEYRLEAASKAQMATDMAAVNETRRIEQEKRELEKQQELEKKEALSTDSPETAISEPVKTTPSQPTLQEIPFIIKADVSGSVEAVLNSVTALGNSEVRPSILRSGVGPVTESDVEHAAIAKGHIITFNTPLDTQILRKAEKEGVQVLDQNIIYRLVDDVRRKLEEILPPLVTTKVVGEAEVAQIFQINVHGRVMVPVAGCKVRNLVVRRNGKVRVLRGKEVVYDGTLSSLKFKKKDVTEMRSGTECGMSFEGWTEFQVGDQVQCYEENSEKRSL